jgi:CRISPR-associated endonuclease/helicase Cas3
VDFDYLVTDLCPIDVLLQRLGRVHRHIRTRPVGCEEPSASIILPEIALREGTSGHGHASLRALGLGSVYQDLVTLELTVRLLERQPMLEIPEGSRALIEAVYHPSPREALGASDDAWGAYLIRQEGEESGRRSLAMQLRIPLFSRGYSSREVCDLFRMTSDQELQARTRLGDDRVIIPLPVPVAHHFTSAPADSVLSLEWRKLRLDPGQPIPAAELVRSDSPFTVQLGRVLLQYQRVGWVSTLAPGSAE